MMIVVTGGSGSGKSAFAEQKIVSLSDGNRIYLATMHPYDEESFRRIDRHRAMRAEKGFATIERYTGIDKADYPKGSTVLLECMSNLVANEMFEPEGAKEHTVSEILRGIQNISKTCEHIVIVTNEIFSDAFSYEEETLRYQKYLGEINCKLAAMADEVYEVVYGIPICHKGAQKNEKTLEQF